VNGMRSQYLDLTPGHTARYQFLELAQEIVLVVEHVAIHRLRRRRQWTSSFFSVIATTGRNFANSKYIMKKKPNVPNVIEISTMVGL